MLVLTQAALRNLDLKGRMAALVHDFGKGLTPLDKLPAHHGHEVSGVALVEKFCDRLTVPSAMTRDLKVLTRYHMHSHKVKELSSKGWYNMLKDLRDDHIVKYLHSLWICDHRGRLGSENEEVDHLDRLVDFAEAYKSVKFVDVFGENFNQKPDAVKQKMFQARVKAVQSAKNA